MMDTFPDTFPDAVARAWVREVALGTITVEDALVFLMSRGYTVDRRSFVEAVEAWRRLRDLHNGVLEPHIASNADRRDIDRLADRTTEDYERLIARMARRVEVAP